MKRLEIDLAALARLLNDPACPPQTSIASAVGLDQPLISRARNGELKRVTPRVEQLWEYMLGLFPGGASAPAESDPVATIASGDATAAEAAMIGLRSYLDDGCDARLVVEQLLLLRRAQLRALPRATSLRD